MSSGSVDLGDEKALIEQAKTDKQAFGQLYERHMSQIYNYLYYRTGNSHDAEDLTEKVFFRALQHIDRYEDKGVPFSAWLYRIARNLLSNWYRDEGKRRTISIDKIEHRLGDNGPEFATELAEDRDVLLAAIRRLPADRQELLILKFVERMTNAEIGTVLGRTEGAIKSLYHRTLLALREEMKQPEPVPRKAKKSKRNWIALDVDNPGNDKGNREPKEGAE